MAENENDHKFWKKSKSFIFNRSSTMQSTSTDTLKKAHVSPSPGIERASSIKKLYGAPIETMVTAGNSIKGKVKKLRSLLSTSKSLKLSKSDGLTLPTKSKLLKSDSKNKNFSNSKSIPLIRLPGTGDRIVVYFTSLHGIRRTFDDCYAVRMIFRGFRVYVDERDLSMDSLYKKELESVLGEKNVSLPRVFIRGKYMGGADAIKLLHENGELAKILDGFPVMKPGYVCDGCGGQRFFPCMNCDGSTKVFDEDDDVVKRCLECNENGLIRCPNCCS